MNVSWEPTGADAWAVGKGTGEVGRGGDHLSEQSGSKSWIQVVEAIRQTVQDIALW